MQNLIVSFTLCGMEYTGKVIDVVGDFFIVNVPGIAIYKVHKSIITIQS